jgi:hypothetical protein
LQRIVLFFQCSGFLGEKSLFPGEKVHSERDLSYGKSTEQRRVQKSREQYSTVEQTRAEKKRVDITAENSRAEQN